ncbi:PD-(D/E)XK nuclease family protein [Prevotella sp. A2931]|uniref:PD-(D/E)XK nuclease family protein n=1 Tax=Prevotella illustrans TaxID=2800387 RepID=A0ABS3M2M5_9BACT|nr:MULTISPECIES: PD-(D/E)XK nuclease family protein [Prevotella]MBO1362423.1 PD-(D/E)XK nuclease family protein [Prevotella illustrans]PTL25064.1 nuclease [Prevotella sp. oral taxon 820]
MNTFLHDVANDIIQKYGTNLSRIAVVFPNKRASLFLNQYLAKSVDKPLWSPAYITISDLFRQHSTKVVADPIKLICDLHKSFNEVTMLNESLDHFYGWGELLLSDFDDVDKNMGNPQLIFSNLKDIHELDNLEYLTSDQLVALKRFFSNFSEEQDSELKRRFLQLWSNIELIYNDFKKRLARQNIAYEGMLYREVAELRDIEFKYDLYIFVGFNMMHKAELAICDKLRAIGKAKFYWDFDRYYMPKEKESEIDQEAGRYVASYLRNYPNEFDNHDPAIYNHFTEPKAITFVSSATENIQGRYVSHWLQQGRRMEDGSQTAIILCNEGLLQTVIHSLPSTYSDISGEKELKVNVTTGYPLQQSPVSTFVKSLFLLQTEGYKADLRKYRWYWVKKVLGHPYSAYLSENIHELLIKLNDRPRVLLQKEELGDDEGTQLLFKPVEGNEAICSWICEVLQYLGIAVAKQMNNRQEALDPLLQESLFRMYTLMNRLLSLIQSGDLSVDVMTLQSLLQQLIASTAIPFHGEPIIGVQVMGVLETRNLDFKHVLILSCNEGNMPKGVNDASFIPYSIRKANELTTIDNKVNIYAYYFYRLLQRAQDVTILYNNACNDGQKGEMSRFMLQLLVESNHPIRRENLNAGQTPLSLMSAGIKKDENVMKVLDGMEKISPSALGVYLRCQLRFYYQYIAGIKQPDNQEEEIDNRIFGNIFHRAAELLYLPYTERGNRIELEDLQQIKKDELALKRLIDRAFKEEFFNSSANEQVEYNGLQLITRQVILSYMKNLIELDMKKAPFFVIGTEKEIDLWYNIKVGSAERRINLYGKIDRLDRTVQDELQIIDYKTGRASKSMVFGSVDEIFTPKSVDKHADYYLQAMLYALMVSEDTKINPNKRAVSPSLLFIQSTFNNDYNPILAINKKEITDIADYKDVFTEEVMRLVAEILNPDNNFEPTAETHRCTNCPYRQICKSSEKC